MILYFADRDLNIIGNASTELTGTYIVISDNKKEDVDTGVSTFEGKIIYDQVNRLVVENLVAVGNTIFRYEASEYSFTDDDSTELTASQRASGGYIINGFQDVFTIIESEIDTQAQTIYFYAEDGGLDLLNDLVGSYYNNNKTYLTYAANAIADTDFTIIDGISDSDKIQLSLSWDGNQTIIERLQDIAAYFEYEFSFGFNIVGMTIKSKWIKFVKERGKDTGQTVTINRRVDNILIKKSIANLATALLPVGDDGLTLDGYQRTDPTGDFIINGSYLQSEKAKEKWGGLNGRHIRRPFNCEAKTQAELYDKALEELKKRIEPEANYDVDVVYLPDGVRLGDRINVVDDDAELYISGRNLKMDTSVVNNSKTVTLGEWKIKSAGISAKVQELASAFSKVADSYYVSIEVVSVDYGSNTAQLKAHVYKNNVEIDSASDEFANLSFSWTKNNGTTELGTSYILNVTDTNARYICKVS